MFAALYYPLVFTTRFQVIYLVGTLVVFCAVASVAMFTARSAPIDNFGARHDLWTYPSCVNPPHPPLAVYIGQALMFVGTIAPVLPDLLRFGPMPASLFADLAAWAIVVAVALSVTRLVAGPATLRA